MRWTLMQVFYACLLRAGLKEEGWQNSRMIKIGGHTWCIMQSKNGWVLAKEFTHHQLQVFILIFACQTCQDQLYPWSDLTLHSKKAFACTIIANLFICNNFLVTIFFDVLRTAMNLENYIALCTSTSCIYLLTSWSASTIT